MASYTARGGSESQSDKEVRYKQERATQTLIRVENLGMNSGGEESPRWLWHVSNQYKMAACCNIFNSDSIRSTFKSAP